MLPLYPALTARNHRKNAEKQKEHFTGEDYIAKSPAAPTLYLVFSYKEKTPATASKGTFYGGERTFYGGIGTFYGGIGTFYGGENILFDSRKSQYLQGFPGFSLPLEKS